MGVVLHCYKSIVCGARAGKLTLILLFGFNIGTFAIAFVACNCLAGAFVPRCFSGCQSVGIPEID
jgi:hypothetical protein